MPRLPRLSKEQLELIKEARSRQETKAEAAAPQKSNRAELIRAFARSSTGILPETTVEQPVPRAIPEPVEAPLRRPGVQPRPFSTGPFIPGPEQEPGFFRRDEGQIRPRPKQARLPAVASALDPFTPLRKEFEPLEDILSKTPILGKIPGFGEGAAEVAAAISVPFSVAGGTILDRFQDPRANPLNLRKVTERQLERPVIQQILSELIPLGLASKIAKAGSLAPRAATGVGEFRPGTAAAAAARRRFFEQTIKDQAAARAADRFLKTATGEAASETARSAARKQAITNAIPKRPAVADEIVPEVLPQGQLPAGRELPALGPAPGAPRTARAVPDVAPDLAPRNAEGAIIMGGMRKLLNIPDAPRLLTGRQAWAKFRNLFEQMETLGEDELLSLLRQARANAAARGLGQGEEAAIIVNRKDVYAQLLRNNAADLNLSPDDITALVTGSTDAVRSRLRTTIQSAQDAIRQAEMQARGQAMKTAEFGRISTQDAASLTRLMHTVERLATRLGQAPDTELEKAYDQALAQLDSFSNKDIFVDAVAPELSATLAQRRLVTRPAPGSGPVPPSATDEPLLTAVRESLKAADDAPDLPTGLGTAQEQAVAAAIPNAGKAPRVQNVPTGEVPHPAMQASPELAQASIADLLEEPILDSISDVAASAAIKASRAGGIDPAKDMVTAYATARQNSGPLTAGKGVEAAPFRPLGKGSGFFLDITRIVQTLDSGVGRAASTLQAAILWPTRRLIHANIIYQHAKKRKFQALQKKTGLDSFRTSNKVWHSITDILENLTDADAAIPTEELVTRVGISRATAGLDAVTATKAIELSRQLRLYLTETIEELNLVRVAQGRKPIAFRQNYVPHLLRWHALRKLAGQDVVDVLADADVIVTRQSPIPDFISRQVDVKNPRGLERKDVLDKAARETDIRKLLDSYLDSTGRDIFFTDIVENARANTKVLRSRAALDATTDPRYGDYALSAQAIDDWVEESFLNFLPDISRSLQGVLPGPIAPALIQARQMLNRSVFAFNPAWNLFVQTSSAALILLRYGPINTFKGLDYFRPTTKRWVQENVYSAIVKGQRGGQAAQQDLAVTASASLNLRRAPLETVLDWGNFLTNAVEESLTGIGIRAGYHHGVARGFKGRQLLEYASDGGAKTQSMYNIADRPGLLRSRELQALVPFQTFAFELFNTVRELPIAGKAFGAGQQIGATNTEAIRNLLLFFGSVFAWNIIAEKAINRKPWALSSFVPFFQVPASAWNGDGVSGRSGTLPQGMLSDFTRGVNDAITKNSYRKLKRFFTRHFIPGGTQVDRIWEGIIATSQGEVRDIQERILFEINTDSALDQFRTVAQGPYMSKEGREYIKELRSANGPFSDLLGLRTPRRYSLDELDELEQQFGVMTLDESTNAMRPFSPADWAKRARWLRIKVSPKRFRNETGRFGRLFLEFEAGQEAFNETYRTKPSTIRRAALRNDPRLDALMLLFGSHTRVQTPAAVSHLSRWTEEFQITADALPPIHTILR